MSEPLDLESIRARQRGRLPGVQLDISALIREVEDLRAELARRDQQTTAVRERAKEWETEAAQDQQESFPALAALSWRHVSEIEIALDGNP